MAIRRRRGFRRRRKTKYTWLPVIGEAGATFAGGPEGANDSFGSDFSLQALSDPNIPESQVIIGPVTFDHPTETSATLFGTRVDQTTPMSVFMGNEYLLKRIVGKVYVSIDSRVVNVAAPSAALVACAFFVARAGDDSEASGSLPIGVSASSAESGQRLIDYNPLNSATAREPWIWRRTWILSPWGAGLLNSSNSPQNPSGENLLDNLVDVGGGYFPPTNVHYGDMQSGPHIDAKTARRIRQDERLFFVAAARAWKLHQAITDGAPLPIVGHLDIRLLGAARKARNRGAF